MSNELLVGVIGGLIVLGASVVLVFMRWKRQMEKVQTRQLDQAERASEKQSMLLHELMARTMKAQMEQSRGGDESGRGREKGDSAGAETAGLNSGGYIIFNMPDSKKALFHDLLKGFEEYGRLRGYVISFSIDNSFTGKVAFKFTLDSAGINVSTRRVKEDLQEYINKVQRGDSLDDLPVVLSPEEHGTLLTCMKNRISFLQHSYNLQKNAAEFYMGLLKQLPSLGSVISHPQNFYMLSGDGSQASGFQALNSPQSIQGAGNRLIGNLLDESVHIANSFNDRKAQVDAVENLYWALYNEGKNLRTDHPEDPDAEKFDEAQRQLRKVVTELQEEQPPDPTRIRRWLETAKYSLTALGLTKEVKDAAIAAWELFKQTFPS